jgi:hypothetical protein
MAGPGMTHEGVYGYESYNGSGYFGYFNVSRCRRERKPLNVNVGADGEKEVLGLWIKQTEGAKFWLSAQ